MGQEPRFRFIPCDVCGANHRFSPPPSHGTHLGSLVGHVTKQLDRKLGFWSVYSIAVGAMLGSGIFVLPGLAASIAGPYVSLSYLLAGVLVLPAVLSKAELATAMPVAGGSFVYVDRSMGPWLGTITGLGTWFALSAKTAFALVGLGGYLVLFTSVPTLPVSLGILLLLLAVNFLGAGKVSGLQVVVVAATLLCLVGFASVAGISVHAEHFSPALPHGIEGIVAGAGFVFVSYNGVTKICSVAEEVQHPERNIPLGMLAAQGTVMVLYSIIAWVCVGHLNPTTLADEVTPVASAALAVLGRPGQLVLSVVAVVGLVSMCNAGILATSRFPFAMGRARVFPSVFERVSARFGTPYLSLLATGLLLVALVTVLPVQKLAKLASGFTIFIFCIVNAAVIVLRESGPRWYAPTFRSPLYPWTQIAGILGGIALIAGLGELAIVSVVGGVVVGSVWYGVYARHRIERRGALQHLVGEVQSIRSTELMELSATRPDARRRVVVPVFGAEPAAERLVRLAAAFAEDGLLEVIRYEEVSEQTPLGAALEQDAEADHLADESAMVGRQEHVGVEFRDVLTHNAKEAAHQHALATGAEWLVLEVPPVRGLRRWVRYPLAWWVEHAPCDQAIFLDRMGAYDGDTTDDFPRILVFAEPGPHDSLLMHVADRLAETQQGSRITLFAVVQEERNGLKKEDWEAYHAQLARLCRREVTSQVSAAGSWLDAVREGTSQHDLLVISGAAEAGLRTVFRGSRAHDLAEAAQCSVLTVKAPRHKVHARLPLDRLPLLPGRIAESAAVCRVNVGHRDEVFARVGRELSALTRLPAARLTAALSAREAEQTTVLPSGVAVMGIVLVGVSVPAVCVLTTLRAVPFQRRHGARSRVDVVLVVVAAPSHRAEQLALLATMAAVAASPAQLDALRTAGNDSSLRRALLHAVPHAEGDGLVSR